MSLYTKISHASSPRIVSLLKRKYEASEATISVVNPIRI